VCRDGCLPRNRRSYEGLVMLIPLGILAAQVAAIFAYRLQTLGGAQADTGRGLVVDSLDNIYVVGDTSSAGAGSSDLLVVKYDSSGTIQWQRVLGGASAEFGFALAVDSLDNIYVSARTASAGVGGTEFLTVKYDSSGAVQWQVLLGLAGNEFPASITVDSSDNVYICGSTSSIGAGGTDFLTAKYNSSGVLQWQKLLGGTPNENARGIVTDSSANVYVVGQHQDVFGPTALLFAKYNSSGTIQFQRFLSGASPDDGNNIAIDSLGDLYVVGFTGSAGAGGNDLLLAKYNSAGTVQWQRVLGGAADDRGLNVTVDSLDNIYVVGQTASTGAGSTDFLIAKYDSSGTIQWQRVLGGVGADIARAIKTDSLDNLCIFGSTTSTGEGNADFLLAVLPSDGSLTGVYVLDGENITYATSTLTAGTSTLTASTPSLTDATATLTAATSTLTAGTPTLTEHRVNL